MHTINFLVIKKHKIKNIKGDASMGYDTLVSILCMTYNHEKYISDAIEGFLSQKTNFKYEILIHDDASTDRTAQIIKEYELKYPHLIKPIYQKENQYSIGLNIDEILTNKASGKYFALCEGDDYWTDPYKLQKQVDFLEEHPDFSLCVHAALKINAITGEEITKIRPSDVNREFSTEEIILGGGGLFATNSMVYRKNDVITMPDFYIHAPVGDYPLAIFLSLRGKVYYFDEIMSVYRYGVPGSWSIRIENASDKERINFLKDYINMLDEINYYTNNKYYSIIEKIKTEEEFQLYLLQRNVKELKKDKYSKYYNALGIRDKISLHMQRYFPHVYKILTVIKKVSKSANDKH